VRRDISQINAKLAALNADSVASLRRKDTLAVTKHAASRAERKRLLAEKENLQLRREKLTIIAQQDGVFAPLDEQLLPGRHIAHGERIAHVVSGQKWTVRLLLPENRAAQLHSGIKQATVRLAEVMSDKHNAQVLRQTPAITRRLPSAALSHQGGGNIATDPFDSSHLLALENLLELELALPVEMGVTGLGQRAWVRLEHPAESLLARLYRAVRKLTLQTVVHSD